MRANIGCTAKRSVAPRNEVSTKSAVTGRPGSLGFFGGLPQALDARAPALRLGARAFRGHGGYSGRAWAPGLQGLGEEIGQARERGAAVLELAPLAAARHPQRAVGRDPARQRLREPCLLDAGEGRR